MNAKTISFLFLLLVALSCKVNHLVDTEAEFYRLNPEAEFVREDTAIATLIRPYKMQLEAEMNEIVGELTQELTKGQPESTLGNWFADLLYDQTKVHTDQSVDFALVNYGGIRIPSLPAGPLTKGRLFELMPFDNMVVIVAIDGQTLTELFALMAEKGGWPVSRQVTYAIVDGTAEGVKIDGAPLQADKVYYVSMSDYVADGGSDCSFLTKAPREELGIFLRDLIIEYCKDKTAKGHQLQARLDKRVTLSF